MRLSFLCYGIATLVTAINQPIAAQVADPDASASNQTVDTLAPLSTLESIRSSTFGLPADSERAGMGMGAGMAGMDMGAAMGMAPTARQLLLQQINQLRLMLNAPNQDRKELEPMLREALAEYFVLDMEERVREFDKIKARVVQMESKLQTRLDRRYEVVELQIKQMLHKADGLDFFVPDGAANGGGMPAGMGMMGGGDAMMSGEGSPMMGGSGGMGMEGAMGAPGGGLGGDGMMTPGGRSSYAGSGGIPGADSIGLPAQVPGYDVGFRMTRYLRFPSKTLKPADPLQIYLALDAKSDRENDFSNLDSRASDEEKLKVLLLAMHNFVDIFKHFPAPANRRDRSEKPHSWRVALLPILGHAELYKQYCFDEAWDSESNLKLVAKMPAVFGSKNDSGSKTSFQMLVGGGAAFDVNRPTEMQDITDGTSNTIALAVASASVPWTKPEDIQFVPNASLTKLAATRLVGMCDGRVRKLPAGGEQVLTIFATRSGGERTPE